MSKCAIQQQMDESSTSKNIEVGPHEYFAIVAWDVTMNKYSDLGALYSDGENITLIDRKSVV